MPVGDPEGLRAALDEALGTLVVVAEHLDFCPPCGGCRQRLAELAGPDTPVHLGRPGGERRTLTVGELLPLSFTLDP